MSNIEVAEEREDGTLVLLPVGRLDSANARAFESIVMDHIGKDERKLVFDFGRLSFISSSGMRVLLIAAKRLKKENIALCNMEDHIEEVFRVSGFDQIIPICGSRKVALKVVGSGASAGEE